MTRLLEMTVTAVCVLALVSPPLALLMWATAR